MAVATMKTTSIERGLPNGRIQRGMGYTTTKGTMVHTNMQCNSPRDKALLCLVPLYEEDGQLYAKNDVEERKVRMCDECPEVLDTDWQDGAACRGSGVDFVSPPFDDIEEIIETYCDNCPVVVQCLAYAINGDNMGIWGGMFLPYRVGERAKVIASL